MKALTQWQKLFKLFTITVAVFKEQSLECPTKVNDLCTVAPYIWPFSSYQRFLRCKYWQEAEITGGYRRLTAVK